MRDNRPIGEQLAKRRAHTKTLADSTRPDPESLRAATSMLDSIGKGIAQRESQADQRVRLFLTLCAGSIGFLSLLRGFGTLPGVDWYWVTITVLSILLLFGIETLQSLNWKHVYTRVDAKFGNSLLASLSEQYPFVEQYRGIVQDADKLKDAPSRNVFSIPWHKVRGTHSEFMYASNALLASAIILTLIWGAGVCWTFTVCLLTFLLAVRVQYAFSRKTRDRIPLEWV